MERNKTLFADDVMLCIQNLRTVRTNQQISVSCRTQNQHTKVSDEQKKFRMYQRPKCKLEHFNTLRGKHDRTFFDTNLSNLFFNPPPGIMKIKTE